MLHLYSEPVAPTGSLAATGVRNVLGRPDLDFWALFARELVQNSCDARLDDARAVQFDVDVRALNAAQRSTLLREVLRELPPDGDAERWTRLRDDPRVIVVSDSGTAGLGGPVRADEASDGPSDFADFVWNVGQPPEKKKLGGGTYGYGKSVLYRASAVGIVLAYSRCRTSQGLESRLIACALCDPYEQIQAGEMRRFTGRHWWGARTRGGAPLAPIVGSEADRIAGELGIVRDLRTTGTTLMVVSAALSEFDETESEDLLATVARSLANSISWHCWPLLSGVPGVPPLKPRVRVDGQEIAVPDPRSHHELRHFVRALNDVASGADTTLDVALQKPVLSTGRLAIVQHVDDSEEEPGRPVDGSMHHVALMRHPHLVVTYLAGPRSALPHVAWSGVFVAHDSLDRVFADSEPPAHDSWVPKSVDDQARRRVVNVTLRRIGELARDRLLPQSDEPAGADAPLGAVSDYLGDLLSPLAGHGVSVLPPAGGVGRTGDLGRGGGGGTGGGGMRPGSARILGQVLALEGEDRILRVAFRASAGGATPVRVAVRPSVATNDGVGRELEPPVGSLSPRVLRYVSAEGRLIEESAVEVTGKDEDWEAVVSLPEEVAVFVRLDIETAPR